MVVTVEFNGRPVVGGFVIEPVRFQGLRDDDPLFDVLAKSGRHRRLPPTQPRWQVRIERGVARIEGVERG